MIPAKITNLNPVQVTGYRLPEPNYDDYDIGYDYEHEEIIYDESQYESDVCNYLASKFIADVENVDLIKEKSYYYQIFNHKDYGMEKNYDMKPLQLNQSCFIEETSPGKCKIVKLK